MKMGMIVGVFYFSSQPLQMFYMKEYKIPFKNNCDIHEFAILKV